MGYSASLNLDLNTLNSATNSNTTFGEKKSQTTIGSTIEKNNGRWEVPLDDKKNPEPMTFELQSIATVCSKDGFWNGLSKKAELKVTKPPLSYICSNLKNALKSYAKYLKLKNQAGNFNV